MRTMLPSTTAKQVKGEKAMYGKQELDSLDALLSSIAREGLHGVDGRRLGREETKTDPEQAPKETATASHHRRPDIESRLRRIEARLAYVGVSLSYMEASRNYIELRLEDAADDVAYAGDTALGFEEIRQLYADPYSYSASSREVGLLARLDAALEGIHLGVAEIEARLAQARSGLAYSGVEVSLSHIEIDLADIEAGLVRISASIAHADALLSEVIGAGTGAPTLVDIPLPSAGRPAHW